MYYKDLTEFKKSCGYEIDGMWYPRVTSIISIKAKPALYKFYADHGDFATAEAMKNKSAQEGTLVHDVIERLLTSQEVPIPDAVKPIVDAFREFRNQHDIVAHQIETKIFSKKHGYAGTIDVLAEVDGKLGILDIKTSYAIYRDYGIQTAAYVEALYELPSIPDLTRWILRLDQSRACLRACGARLREKGGSSKIKTNRHPQAHTCSHIWGDLTGDIEFKELKDYDHDLSAFLASKTLWEWEHDYWISKIRKSNKRYLQLPANV